MQKLQRNQKTLQLNQRLTVQLKAKIAAYVSKESESILSRRDFPILKFVVHSFLDFGEEILCYVSKVFWL